MNRFLTIVMDHGLALEAKQREINDFLEEERS